MNNDSVNSVFTQDRIKPLYTRQREKSIQLARLRDTSRPLADRYNIAHREYFTNRLLTLAEITDALGISLAAFPLVVGIANAKCVCPDCGAEHEIDVYTRHELDLLPASSSDPHAYECLCIACELDEPAPVTAATLRTMPYKDYLNTAHWQQTRTRALERAGHSCQLCNSQNSLQVHHRTYERRGCERDDDLTVLCARCHSKFHEE